MRSEVAHCVRAMLCVALLLLAACGQTGPLLLPGTELQPDSPVTDPGDNDDQEEDD